MGKKGLFLFLALLLPALIFVFLKMFGKNEFHVALLFQTEKPAVAAGCEAIALPYRVKGDVLSAVLPAKDSLALIYFVADSTDAGAATELAQLKTELAGEPVRVTTVGQGDDRFAAWYPCVFLMRAPLDVVLVDRHGSIRGQYALADRDEADRLRTEITIILKKY